MTTGKGRRRNDESVGGSSSGDAVDDDAVGCDADGVGVS
jgi:hypothetical protein